MAASAFVASRFSTLISISILAVFALDFLISLEYAICVLYLFPLLLTMWTQRRRNTLMVAGICTLLIVVGFALSPVGTVHLKVAIFNHCLGILLIWLAAMLLAKHKQVETALEKSRRLLTETEHVGKVGGWEFDVDTQKQTWTEEVFRIHEEDRIFEPTVDMGINYYTPASRPIIEGAVRMALEQNKPFDVELEIITAKGNLRSIHAIGAPDLEHRRVYGFFQDITGPKRAKAALEQSAQELQAKNAEFERFLNGVTHDIKSPLVTIQAFVGYLQEDVAAADTARIAKDSAVIDTAVDRISHLMDGLLDISRIGRLVNPPVEVTFRELVDEARGAVAGQIAIRGVTVQVAEREMMLRGDRVRLVAIWQNLLDNACKFMGNQKEPCIEISIAENKGETTFFVRDNGIGINPSHQAKVFDFCEKLDPKSEGTGLGLALIKRIVELYGGRIWVESAGLGQGACFYFTLPGAVGQKSGVRSQWSGVRR
jgi:signal transduction histidine kinase